MAVWKIIFEGNLFDGQKQEIVKKRLASLFNTDLAKVERLFQGGKVTIKSGIDYRTALKFQDLIQKTGAKCRVIQIEKAPSKAEASAKRTPPSQEKTKTDISSTSLSTDNLLDAFQGDIDPIELSRPYNIRLPLVGIVMVLLPLLYIALILMISYGIYYHATENIDLVVHMKIWEKLAFLTFGYVAPLVFGTILIIFMIKPILAPRPIKAGAISLNPYKEKVLFDFIRKISGIVRAPIPRRIEIDCDVNASASFNIGFISLFEEDLVLKLGLPLVAGLNTRQFAGVLAHELGHFSSITGMRLNFIIRKINHWFSQTLCVRDIWDEKLEKWSEEADLGFRPIIYIARFFVWITRKIIGIFVKTGHLTSCFLIRQMEFDADRFQTRVAGSKQFADICLRLKALNIASEQASADLREVRDNMRLADNLPDLILSNKDRITPLSEAHFKRHIIDSETGFLDSRPSDKDRIVSALKEKAKGIFRLEVPAKLLFSDFNNLSRDATIFYYRNEINITVTGDNLISVQAFNRYKHDLLQGHDVLEHYFSGIYTVLRPLPIQLHPGMEKKTLQQRIDSLLKKLYLAKEMAPRILQALKNYESANEKALTMLQAKLLLQANLSMDKESFQLTDCSEEGIEKALNKALSEKSAADSLLCKVEGLLANRLELALSLLKVPDSSKNIKDADELKEESERLINAYLPFSSVVAILDELGRTYVSVTSLAYNYLNNQDNETLSEMIQKMKADCKGHIADLYSRLKDIPYPFDHAQGDISVAEYMIENDPEEIDEGAVLKICESVIDKMFTLHAELLGRLAVISGTVEEAVLPKKG